MPRDFSSNDEIRLRELTRHSTARVTADNEEALQEIASAHLTRHTDPVRAAEDYYWRLLINKG